MIESADGSSGPPAVLHAHGRIVLMTTTKPEGRELALVWRGARARPLVSENLQSVAPQGQSPAGRAFGSPYRVKNRRIEEDFERRSEERAGI
jgi:hypothetical protein